MANKLTIKQEKFCRETIKNSNATVAVKKVYSLASKGGSDTPEALDTTARAIASQNLRKPAIQYRLNELLSELKIDKNSRLQRLSEIFYCGDVRAVLGANDQITKILGEYHEPDNKIINIFADLDKMRLNPAQEAENEMLEAEKVKQIEAERFEAREKGA
jgi:phage terminase small subunit